MKKNKFISYFVLVCLTPLLLAALVLHNGWFNAGRTNKGQWFADDVQILPPVTVQQAHWRLVYQLPAECLANCQQVLTLMQHIDLALGRKNTQLDLILLSATKPIALPDGFSVEHAVSPLPDNRQLVLVEQHGMALLSYPLPSSEEGLPMVGKALLADLQKLMKFDRGPA